MSFSEELKRLRQRTFMSQEAFAKELNVSFSTVNRWEGGRTKPNLAAMKSIKEFCVSHGIAFEQIEEKWLDYDKEENGNG